MSKTVTLRLDEVVYRKLRLLADQDNRPLSNFIETAALRYVEREQYVDDYEMDEIRKNRELNASLARGLKDADAKKGTYVKV